MFVFQEKIMSAESLEEMEEIVLPVKSEAIFGLDREMIVKRITSSVNKSKDAWAGNSGRVPNLDEKVTAPNGPSGLYSVEAPERNAQLKEFLRLRKVRIFIFVVIFRLIFIFIVDLRFR